MEKLIIILLLGVASTVFRAMTSQAKKPVESKGKPGSYKPTTAAPANNNNRHTSGSTTIKASGSQKSKAQSNVQKTVGKDLTDWRTMEGIGGGSLSAASSNEGSYYDDNDNDYEAVEETDTINDQDYEDYEDYRIDITEDIQKSILAAEILGPPRAFKKNIR